MAGKEIRSEGQAVAGPLRNDNLSIPYLEWILPQLLHDGEVLNVYGVGDGCSQRDMQLGKEAGSYGQTVRHCKMGNPQPPGSAANNGRFRLQYACGAVPYILVELMTRE